MLSRPLPLLLLVTALFTFLIQSGELGTSDTTHRLQVTHSLWTAQPQVFAWEYPEFGVHGRGGLLYAWYGIGQSLLMLPADLAGTAASHLPLLRSYVASGADPAVRSIVVSVSTNVLVNVLTALACFRLLGLLDFSVRESIAGTLALLCATTHLHYAQNMTENNYILLLTLTGFALQFCWLKTGSVSALLWGSAALGLNLLTRLTTGLDVFGAGCFLALCLITAREPNPGARLWSGIKTDLWSGIKTDLWSGIKTDLWSGIKTDLWSGIKTYVRVAVPVFVLFLAADRLYQYHRFGSWTNTYLALFAVEQRHLNPALPANFPFNGHWLTGILGPLFAPWKSIFLFDPLLPLTLALLAYLWKHLPPATRVFAAATLLLLAAYIGFYARYLWWAGDFSWGDRYVSSAVELASLVGVPLLLRYRLLLGRTLWRLSLGVVAVSAAIQCASLAFWLPLEIYQQGRWVIPLRFENIAAFALGKRAAWGLNAPAIFEDPWDAAHLTAWNFLPSLLRHIGVAPLWVVDVLDWVWMLVAVLLVLAFIRLMRSLRVRQPAYRDGPALQSELAP